MRGFRVRPIRPDTPGRPLRAADDDEHRVTRVPATGHRRRQGPGWTDRSDEAMRVPSRGRRGHERHVGLPHAPRPSGRRAHHAAGDVRRDRGVAADTGALLHRMGGEPARRRNPDARRHQAHRLILSSVMMSCMIYVYGAKHLVRRRIVYSKPPSNRRVKNQFLVLRCSIAFSTFIKPVESMRWNRTNPASSPHASHASPDAASTGVRGSSHRAHRTGDTSTPSPPSDAGA